MAPHSSAAAAAPSGSARPAAPAAAAAPPQQQADQQQGGGYAAWARDFAWRTWLTVDSAVAWLFGLDESKYQWAIDRYHAQQAQIALRARACDGELAAVGPHSAPGSSVMVADGENPRC